MATIDLQIKSVLAEKDKMKFPYVPFLCTFALFLVLFCLFSKL